MVFYLVVNSDWDWSDGYLLNVSFIAHHAPAQEIWIKLINGRQWRGQNAVDETFLNRNKRNIGNNHFEKETSNWNESIKKKKKRTARQMIENSAAVFI